MLRPGFPTAALIVSLLVALLPPSAARAQTEPPPQTALPPQTATAPPPGAGAASGSAAATPGAPLAPTAAPLPAAPPPALPPPPPSLAAEPGALPPLPPTEEHPPIYKQAWFWAAIAVVGLTAAMITYGIASQGPATPTTDLGNMRAF
jgi:hypothetical protein